jgi:type I restriction enzyme S subunit
MKWPVKSLAEVSSLITKGTTPTTLGFEYKTSGIRFLRAQNINDGKVNFYDDDLYIDQSAHNSLSRSIIRNGDLLVSIAGSIGRAGLVDTETEQLNCNQAVAIVRLNDDVNAQYIKHLFHSPVVADQIKKLTVTGVISNLSLSQLGNLKIPLPPLAEQQRIAAQLDTADRILRLREHAIAKLDQLAQSVFLENLNESVMQKVLLSDLAHMYQPKTISSKQLQEDGKYIVYGANGVIGRYDEYNHSDSEVLVTCRGATCGTVNWSEPFAWITGNAMVVKPLKDDVTKKFLFYYFRFVADFTQVITGAAQPQITRESLSRLSVSIPIIEKQKALTDKVDSVYKCHALMSSTQMKLTSLMRTLSHQSFAVN